MRCKKRCLTEITFEIKKDEETRFVCFICIVEDFAELNQLEDDYFSPNPFLQIALQKRQKILISCGYCNAEKGINEYSNLSCSLHNPVCCECLLSNCKVVCPVQSCQLPFTQAEVMKFKATAIRTCSGCSSFKTIQDFNDCARHCICRECQLKEFQDQANRFSPIKYVCKICSENLAKELYPVIHPAPLPIPKLVEEEKEQEVLVVEVPGNEKYNVNCPVCQQVLPVDFRTDDVECVCGFSFCLVCSERTYHKCNKAGVLEFYNKLQRAEVDPSRFSTCPKCCFPSFIGDNDVSKCRRCDTLFCTRCCVYIDVVEAHNSKVLHRETCPVRQGKVLDNHAWKEDCILCIRAGEQTACVVKPPLIHPGVLNEDELE
jgi:hypothetical protein